MNYTQGMCGFKYQVINEDANFHNEFKVLKDRATMLVAGSAFALATLLAF